MLGNKLTIYFAGLFVLIIAVNGIPRPAEYEDEYGDETTTSEGTDAGGSETGGEGAGGEGTGGSEVNDVHAQYEEVLKDPKETDDRKGYCKALKEGKVTEFYKSTCERIRKEEEPGARLDWCNKNYPA